MKQRITVKQLNELSEKGKNKLKEWWNPEEGDWISHQESHDENEEICNEEMLLHYDNDEGGLIGMNYDHRMTNPKEEYILLPSIGQMIKFLLEYDYISRIESPNYSVEPDQWVVETPYKRNMGFSDGDELVDALWYIVKEVLEK